MDIESIKKLAEEMTQQNNRGTAYPLFYIHQKKEVSSNKYDNWHFKIWADDDYREVERMAVDEWDEQKSDQLDDEYSHITYVRLIDKPVVNVGPFFTQKAAQAHIDANDYHYNEPFIFVWGCWRNNEMQELMKSIFKIAGMEIPMPYTY